MPAAAVSVFCFRPKSSDLTRLKAWSWCFLNESQNNPSISHVSICFPTGPWNVPTDSGPRHVWRVSRIGYSFIFHRWILKCYSHPSMPKKAPQANLSRSATCGLEWNESQAFALTLAPWPLFRSCHSSLVSDVSLWNLLECTEWIGFVGNLPQDKWTFG